MIQAKMIVTFSLLNLNGKADRVTDILCTENRIALRSKPL